jgi:hypothetical protein
VAAPVGGHNEADPASVEAAFAGVLTRLDETLGIIRSLKGEAGT